MWKKSESEEPQITPAPQPRVQSPVAAVAGITPTEASKDRAVIGSTIHIKGDLSGEEDLLIQGQVEGKIEFRRHNVTIGKNGRVKADVFGKMLNIEGEVHGNLFGEDQLVLRRSGTVRGNITAPRVVLEDGCNFKGSIDMSPKEAPERQQARPVQPTPEKREVEKNENNNKKDGGIDFPPSKSERSLVRP